MKFSELDFSPLPRFIELLRKIFDSNFTIENTGGLDYDEIEIKFNNEKNIITLRFFDPINSHEIVTEEYTIQTEFYSAQLNDSIKFLVKPKQLDDEVFTGHLKNLLETVPVIQYGLNENETINAISEWFEKEIEKCGITSFIEVVDVF